MQRKIGDTTFCRPQDLIRGKIFKDTTTIDDLEFNLFEDLLANDLSYKLDQDMIVYERDGAKDTFVTNVGE